MNLEQIAAIRRKVIFSVFVIILIFTGFKAYIDITEHSLMRDTKIAHKSEQVKSFFETSLQNLVNSYIIKEHYLIQQSSIIDAFKSRDREKLQELVDPLFKEWKVSDSSLQIIHFHLPDNHSFLRMHKPEKFGDDLSQVRPIITAVNRQNRFLKGFEVGKYNTNVLTYRLAFPVFSGDEYLGVVEFGINFLEKMKEFYKLYGNLYEKQSVSFYGGFLIETVRLQHIESNYVFDEYGNFSLINGSNFVKRGLDSDLIDKRFFTEYRHKSIALDGNYYKIYTDGIYIKNHRKGIDGSAIYVIDITDEIIEFREYIMESILISLLMLIVITIVLVRAFKYFSTQIIDNREQLRELEHWKHEILTLFEDGNIAIFKVENSEDFKVTFVTDSIKDILGFSLSHIEEGMSLKKDLICKECWEFFYNEIKDGEKSLQEHIKHKPLRLKKRDGSLIWVHGVSTLSFDHKGRFKSLLFAVVDITEVKDVESELLVYKNRLELAIESTKDGLWDLDLINKDIYLSNQTIQMLGKEEGFYKRLVKTNSFDKVKKMLIHPEDLKRFNIAIEDSMNGNTEHFGEEIRVKHGDDDYLWYLVRGRVMFDEDLGSPCRIIGFNTDINKQKKIEAHLKELATIDELTGVANRTKVKELLDREVDRARRYRNPLSLIYFDIDHFKQVNDTYGHKAGDNVLIKITQLIQKELRKTDILARWGGEEFLIVIPETSLHNGVVLANKLREIIEEFEFDQASKVTCSFGVTQFTLHDDIDKFIERADKALYEAKDSGRNRVISITGEV